LINDASTRKIATRSGIRYSRCSGIGPSRGVDSAVKERGYSLIEAMVTVLIVSFGLLAVSYMQTWGQRHGQDSAARTQATMIATELLDRIRASGISAADVRAADYVKTPPDELACEPRLAVAANDRNCFYSRIKERLPFGAGSITVEDANRYQVTVAWLDRFANYAANSAPGETDCLGNGRLWSDDSGLTWYPSDDKPQESSCMVVQTWSLLQ
jgi:type IV pilus assembly protein PilV